MPVLQIPQHTFWVAALFCIAIAAINGWLMLQRRRDARQERSRLETSLREAGALLSTVQSQSIVSVVDRFGLITDVNDAFCAISGFTREELVGQSHRIVDSGAHDAAFWGEMWRLIASGKPWRGEICNRDKRGALYWVDSMIAPMFGCDGAIEKYVSIHHDVTAYRQSEQKLRQVTERLDHAIEGSSDGMWDWMDMSTDERWWSPSCFAMLGYRPEELAQTRGAFLALLRPEDVEPWRAGVAKALTEDVPFELDFMLRHKTGDYRWFRTRAKVYRDGQGGQTRMAGSLQDVHARKMTEVELARVALALHASQAFLDRTGRVAGVGGWQFELATCQVSWSRQTYEIHEIPLDTVLSHEFALQFFNGATRELIMMTMHAGIARAKPWDIEVPLLTARGRKIWVRLVGEAEYVDGRAVRVIGAIQDVSERRALSLQLRQSNESLSGVIECLPCGVVVADAKKNITLYNKTFLEVMNVPDELIAQPGLTYVDLLHFWASRGDYGPGSPTDLAAAALALIPIGKHARIERTRPGGVMLEMSFAPMPRGGLVCAITDITERKRIEASARRADALLRGAMEALDEAFVIYDPQGHLVYCNDKYRRISATPELVQVGVNFEQLIRTGAELGHFPAAIGQVDAWVAERVARHRLGSDETLHEFPNGRWMRIADRRMADGHIVGFRIDVTELLHAKQAAEAASQAKSHFVANVSHEIRTPMNAILGMLTLLQQTALTARQRDYAAKTDGAARSLLMLLNDLLDFSKAEAGKVELDPRAFTVGRVLRNVEVILNGNLGSKQVRLDISVDADVPRCLFGDDMRLQQVLVNLGSNAIKFTDAGSVVIRVRLLDSDGEQARIEFSVVDSGVGIAAEHHERIFQVFTQAEASTTRRFGGTGLGLAISQRWVGLMGGAITLESELGCGSTFRFTLDLPVADCLSDEHFAITGPGLDRLAGMRILIVDDNANNRQIARELLEGEGATVDCAENGELGVAAVAAADPLPNAVLMDLQMPVMDGFDATARIRARPEWAALPIIAMTANAQRSDRDACIAAGMNAHVGKPFNLSELVATLLQGTGRAPAPPRLRTVAVAEAPDALLACAERHGIDLGSALHRMGGHRGAYLRLLKSFAADLPPVPDQMAELLAAGSHAALARLMHTVRGVAGTLGMGRLAAVAIDAEKRFASAAANPDAGTDMNTDAGTDAGTVPSGPAMLHDVTTAVDAALVGMLELTTAWDDALRTTVARRDATGQSHSAEDAAVRRSLDELAALLAQADMRAFEVFESLQAVGSPHLLAVLEPLDRAIGELDFLRAHELCLHLLFECAP